MAPRKKAGQPAGAAGDEITINRIVHGSIDLCVLGQTPLILNRLSRKAWQELLLPTGRDKTTLKHSPLHEYRAAPYTFQEADAPTLLCFPAGSFKKAILEAALDVDGVAKAQAQRLIWCTADRMPLYGVPQLFMSIVRDANGTPDVRTRAIVPRWALRISIDYRRPIGKQSVANLLQIAGDSPGVGDWRVGKNGVYGRFDIVNADDRDFVQVVKAGGRKAQLAAMQDPAFYDAETEEMFTWFEQAKGEGKNADKIVNPALLLAAGQTAGLEEFDELDQGAAKRKRGRNGARV